MKTLARSIQNKKLVEWEITPKSEEEFTIFFIVCEEFLEIEKNTQVQIHRKCLLLFFITTLIPPEVLLKSLRKEIRIFIFVMKRTKLKLKLDIF